jgi:peptide deformylase
MALEIAQLGQPVLRRVADPVPVDEIGSSEFQSFLDRMHERLAQARGAGLAAPQVFSSRRVFLAMTQRPANDDDLPRYEFFINPTLHDLSQETAAAWEGCLSFIELLVLVPRHRSLRVDYLDRHGRPQSLPLEGFPARVVQHEYDHLDGVLTIDRAESPHHIIKASEIDAATEAEDKDDDAG